MGFYQFYEFRAVDRPLGRAEREQLRALSTRAQITETRFVNSYDWGDFRGDPARLMERYFDLFLYVPQMGARQFSMRLPARLVAASGLKRFLVNDGEASIRKSGENLIVDIVRDEDELELDPEDDGRGWLDSFASLRADVLDGDLRLFYLVWLMAADVGELPDDAIEPLPGIAPLTPALAAFAEFFRIDRDLVQAAADAPPPARPTQVERQAILERIHTLEEKEKDALLLRLYDGDPHLRTELRRRCQASSAPAESRCPLRTVAALRVLAKRLDEERRAAEAKRRQAEQRRQEKKAAEEKKRRLEALAARGDVVWAQLEQLIGLRKGPAYEEATLLLCDLRDLALQSDRDDEFHQRFREIRERHGGKPRFIERLTGAGLA